MAGVQYFGCLKHRCDSFYREQDPPRLHALEPADLSGFTAVALCQHLALESYTVSAATAAMDHNRKVRAASAENDRRAVGRLGNHAPSVC